MTTQRVDGYEHQCGRPCPTHISLDMFQSFQRTGASQAVFDAGIRFAPADSDDPARGVLRWCAECWQIEFKPRTVEGYVMTVTPAAVVADETVQCSEVTNSMLGLPLDEESNLTREDSRR